MEAYVPTCLEDSSEKRSPGNQLHAIRVIACGGRNSAVENGMKGPQKVPPLTADRDNANGPYL